MSDLIPAPPPPKSVAAASASSAPQSAMAKAQAQLAAANAGKQPEAYTPLPEVSVAPGALESPLPDTAGTDATDAALAMHASQTSAATSVSIDDNDILDNIGALAMHSALQAALKPQDGVDPVFKVVALQSGYTVEMEALGFQHINHILASSVDAYAAKVKILRTIHGRMRTLSCGHIKFDDWLKQTAYGDYDTLVYGVYAATNPGMNEFDVNCVHCQRLNKVSVDVGMLARVASNDVYAEVTKMLDPKTDFKGAIAHSLVGHTVRRRLPHTKMVVEISNPSIQDQLDSVQWFVNTADKATGDLPVDAQGSEVTRMMSMYVRRILVPIPGSNKFAAITDLPTRSSTIARLNKTDGNALTAAVNDEVRRLDVSYSLPAYNCSGCGKKNEDLLLNFENLLFTKLQEKA